MMRIRFPRRPSLWTESSWQSTMKSHITSVHSKYCSNQKSRSRDETWILLIHPLTEYSLIHNADAAIFHLDGAAPLQFL